LATFRFFFFFCSFLSFFDFLSFLSFLSFRFFLRLFSFFSFTSLSLLELEEGELLRRFDFFVYLCFRSRLLLLERELERALFDFCLGDLERLREDAELDRELGERDLEREPLESSSHSEHHHKHRCITPSNQPFQEVNYRTP